jgi:Skp family chaperone for outer membrane proteins
MKKVKKPLLFFALALFLLLPAGTALSISLVRVGFMDVERVLTTYTRNYFDTMIEVQENELSELESEYNSKFYTMGYREKSDMEARLRNIRDELRNLRLNRRVFQSTGEIRDDDIFNTVQKDIMDAVKKTSELEGFSLVLDKRGNFVYGSEEIDLTDKVLFRLDEYLLDLREQQPAGTLRENGEQNTEESGT